MRKQLFLYRYWSILGLAVFVLCIVIHIFSRQATSKSENTPPDDYNPGENIASEDHPKNISGNLRDVAHNLHMAVQGTVIACFCICMNRGFARLQDLQVKLFEKYDNQTATFRARY